MQYQIIMQRQEAAKTRILAAGRALSGQVEGVDAQPLTRTHTGSSEIEAQAAYLETVADFIESAAARLMPTQAPQDGPSAPESLAFAPLSLGASEAPQAAPGTDDPAVPVDLAEATPIVAAESIRRTPR
jgi:hypothetical protein